MAARGALLIAKGNTRLALTGLGMLLHTVIASPGYLIACHETALAAMFAIFADCAIWGAGGGP